MILNKTIFISGNARSGTSIVGKILATCKNSEYAFEPELIPYIIQLKDFLKNEDWKKIYQGYIEEELFFNLLIGRKINFRINEDSSIKNLKSKSDIQKKLRLNISRVNLDNYLKKNKINFIIKFPSIDIKKIISNYKKTKIVLVKRNLLSVILSLYKKKWFKNNSNLINSFLPYKKIGKKKYPYWFEKSYSKIWINCNEITKCAIFTIISERYYSGIKKKYIIRYEDLIDNPKKTISSLIKQLGLKQTHQTKKLIKQIKNNKRNINFENIKKRIHPRILNELSKNF
tara:strand:- start:669 stop:1526 length:858 start_codon:yes stop_codon:yes gene_type:complete